MIPIEFDTVVVRQSLCYVSVLSNARVCVSAENVAAGSNSPMRVLAHYPEVTAHAWPLPA